MKSEGFGATDVGCTRQNNEDAFLVDDRLGLYAVSDGLGGHAAGERASRLAIEAARDSVGAAIREASDDPSFGSNHVALREVAAAALRAACLAVYREANSTPDLAGMGCTLTLLLVRGSKAVMAHVGDTRLYLRRDASTWQLSSDHTIAADFVRRGELTPDEAREHRYSSALTRALGPQQTVEPETLILDVLPDDVLVLCSDGLSRYLEGPSDLNALLGEHDAEGAPEALIDVAKEAGGSDNITAVVVRIVAGDGEQDATLPEEVRAGIRMLRRTPTFDSLRFVDLIRLFNRTQVRRYVPEETVFGAGEMLDGLYIPLDGEAEILNAKGKAVRVKTGDAIGLSSLLVPRPVAGSIRARSELTLLGLPGKEFRTLCRRRPWMGVRALTALGRELGRELVGLAEDGSKRPTRRWWMPMG